MSYISPRNSRSHRSRIFNSLIMFIALAAVVAFILAKSRSVVVVPPAYAAVTGAIYTSLSDGATVNGNVYDNCCDVYLNGGPQNPNGAGLPDGTYYFQVTDPSGATLLSNDDAVCRQLTVSGGVISGAAGPCPHTNGTFNPANGSTPVQLCPFDATPNPGGEYKVTLIAQTPDTTIDGTDPKVIHFINSDTKTDNFKCKESPGQPPQTAIGGVKYYDLNTNGVLDAGEVGIAGWRVDVSYILPDTTAGSTTTFTDSTGTWALVFPAGTTYTACEVLPPNTNYVQTGPLVGATTTDTQATANASRCWEGVVGGSDTSDLNFGNVCLGPGGGHTLGFWSNKNGQATMSDGGSLCPELSLLNGLCLRNADGTNADFACNYSLFRSWLLNATATNMSYMLSAQLAAMELNVEAGFVDGGSFVFAGANPTGCSVPVSPTGFISVNALMSDANSELCADSDGKALAGDPERACQEFKKNALDAANNNQNFVQSTPCPFTTPY
jgi:hypothetical protein